MSRPDVNFYERMTLNLVDATRWDAAMIATRASATHFGIESVDYMVKMLIKMCKGGLWRTWLYELCIVGHGNQTGQWFGADWVNFAALGTHGATLAKLKPYFCAGAVVTLEGCEVGHASSLLRGISNAFGGVPVRAGTAFQRPLIPGLEGGVRTCDPTSCHYTGRTVMDSLDDAILR